MDVVRGCAGGQGGDAKFSPSHGLPGSPLAGAEPVATVGGPKSFPFWCRRCSALVAFDGGELCGRCLSALNLDGGVQFMDHVGPAIGGAMAVVLLVPRQVLEAAWVAAAVLPW